MQKLRRGAAAVLAAALVVGWGMPVGADQNGTRYLVRSSDAALEGRFGALHRFEQGFTTNLRSDEVAELAASGVEVEPVLLYHLATPPEWAEARARSGSVRLTPSDRTPWGIEKMYNNPALAATSGGTGVDVAVLDTGVNKNHPDLSRRVAQCKDFTGVGMRDGRCDDKNGHGTHVAGTVLADGGADGLGIYGMAPGANLFAYRVCGADGSCWSDDISAAIRHAADQGAEVVSMSLGSDVESTLIRDAIAYAVGLNTLVVAAAGNDGPALGSIDYPGANASVVAVAAIDSAEAVPDWSSRGVNDGDYVIEEREVEFAAPGVLVESAWKDGGYRTISGTSMATPHVTGLAAKLWQGGGAVTRSYLQTLVRDLGALGDDPATGFGLPYVH
ncbi:MAG: S8 family serine peptidase [Patescibacteria group bacterium]